MTPISHMEHLIVLLQLANERVAASETVHKLGLQERVAAAGDALMALVVDTPMRCDKCGASAGQQPYHMTVRTEEGVHGHIHLCKTCIGTFDVPYVPKAELPFLGVD